LGYDKCNFSMDDTIRINYHDLSATTKDEKLKVSCQLSVVRCKKQLTTDNFHIKKRRRSAISVCVLNGYDQAIASFMIGSN